MKKTFIFYTDWMDYTEEMDRGEKGLFLETILAYQNGEELPNDIQPIKFIWSRVKKQLDEDNNKWSEEINKRKEAGKLGGLAKASKDKQVLASASKGKQQLADNENENENENENKNKNYDNKEKVGVISKISPIEIGLSQMEIENKPLADSIRSFLSFRNEMKKPIKDASFPIWAKKLLEISGGDTEIAIKILENSIANGWQGIFPLKPEGGNINSNKPQRGTIG